ncbi:malonyl-CoA decarboxylase N-terminal domain-containing protein, partial [Rhizobium johnstonii]
ILDRSCALESEGAQAFLDMLHKKFGPDTAKLDQAIENYRADKSSAAIIALHQAAEPQREKAAIEPGAEQMREVGVKRVIS